MTFPEKLDLAISRSAKSQSALARETGIAQSSISAMTRGERRPYLDQAILLARAIGISLDYLADEAMDEPPANPELPEDERLVLETYRALGIDPREAIRRLHRPSGPPVIHPAPGYSGDERDAEEERRREVEERKGKGRANKGAG